jgi:hypothetical protein
MTPADFKGIRWSNIFNPSRENPRMPRPAPPHSMRPRRGGSSAVMEPALGCTDLRLIKAHLNTRTRMVEKSRSARASTVSGFYDRASRVVNDAKRLNGVSAYITLNPVDPAKLAFGTNTLARADLGIPAGDADIVCRKLLFVDIDSIRPTGGSATDTVAAAAISQRDAILAAHPEWMNGGLWGCSGNGAFLLVPVANAFWPNDEAYRDYDSEQILFSLAAKFDDNTVRVETSVANASRIVPLPGTMKCKEENMIEPKNGEPPRPWRMVTLDSPTTATAATPIEASLRAAE